MIDCHLSVGLSDSKRWGLKREDKKKRELHSLHNGEWLSLQPTWPTGTLDSRVGQIQLATKANTASESKATLEFQNHGFQALSSPTGKTGSVSQSCSPTE